MANGCKTLHAETDVDFLIAKTAIESAQRQDTIFVSEDTVLIVLLCCHGEMDSHNLYICYDSKRLKVQIWDIKSVESP